MGNSTIIRRAAPALLALVLGAGAGVRGQETEPAPTRIEDLPAEPSRPAPSEPAPLDAAPGPSEHGSALRHRGAGAGEGGPDGPLVTPETDEAPGRASPPARSEKPKAERPAPKAPAKPLLLPKAGDGELEAAWARWRKAVGDVDMRGAEAAQKELLNLKDDLGIEDLDTVAIGFLRSAERRRAASDGAGALALTQAAVQLAPDLPCARFTLAEALASSGSLVAAATEVRAGLAALFRDPRYGRPALAGLIVPLLLALAATAGLVLVVLFLARVRYLLHDVHHLFPRYAARWQSAALTLLILSLPLLFRLGPLPVLSVLLLALAFYLDTAERVVAGGLLCVAALVPVLGGHLAAAVTFASTPAEDVYLLERGGLDAARAQGRVARRVAEDRAQYQDLFALARYESRRGKLQDAITHYQKAAGLRANEPRLFTNLANAFFAKGDVDGAADLYSSATQADSSLAAPYFDLAKLYARRAATLPDDLMGAEVDRAQMALATAQKLDEALLTRADPPQDAALANRLLISPTLPLDDIVALANEDGRAAHVASELSGILTGVADPDLAVPLGVAAGVVLTALGALRARGKFAKGCERCGRPVCRRCDPEIGRLGRQCNQCLHVFARSSAVAPEERVRKQMEIRRYQARTGRIAQGLGLLLCGTGHLFLGRVARGGLYLFVFLFAALEVFLAHGVLRAPYAPVPAWLTTVPALLLLLLTYVRSWRGLRRGAPGGLDGA